MNEQKNNEILMKALMAEDQLSAIKIYCEERSKFDNQLMQALNDPEKNYSNCWDYIMKKAKDQLGGKSGHIMPSVIFGWAVHYFTEPNDVLEKEVGKIKGTEKTPPKANEITAENKKKPTKKQDPSMHNASFERMSIFDLMPEDNDDSQDETDDLDEGDDDE